MERLVEAVAEVKCSNTTEGREMRQLLHNICAPPPGSGLVRATARILKLKSIRGLLAGQRRVAEFREQVDAEGDIYSDEESDGDLEGAEGPKSSPKRESIHVPRTEEKIDSDISRAVGFGTKFVGESHPRDSK